MLPLVLALHAALPTSTAAGIAPRLARARRAKLASVRADFRRADLRFPSRALYIRIFKREGVVELWASDLPSSPKRLVRSFAVCEASGGPGPKRRQGDLQVPEGFYHIDRFNPYSSYHLSLGINYPNRADRIMGRGGRLGGDIFIHGDCVSIGCVAITDDEIEPLFVAADAARRAGQKRIPVHIFPARLDDDGMKQLVSWAVTNEREDLVPFWRSLQRGYRKFESTRKVPRMRVARDGRYLLSGT